MRAAKSELPQRRAAMLPDAVGRIDLDRGARPDGVASAIDDELLAELSHEIGNHFHKLYFCAERVGGAMAEAGADAPSGELLARTVRSLEEILGAAIEYFRPVRLERVPMTGAELATALEGMLRGQLDGARVVVSRGPGVDTATLSIDPARFSAAMRILARELAWTRNGAPHPFGLEAELVRTRQATGESVEVELRVPASLGGPAPAEQRRVLERAIAAKVLSAHGGWLAMRTEAGGSPGCTVSIPIAGEDRRRSGQDQG